MRLYLLVVLAALAVGCSDSGVASQDANAPIKVEISQLYVTVRNESGLALTDVTVGIVPVGRTTIFTKFVGRVESAEARNIMLGEFMGRDGTPLNLRVTKPRSVEVKGKDVNGKDYAVEMAWR
jgi:hypothetical protein